MKILIVYDSVFGNTEQVARAIGAAFGAQAQVETLRVADFQPACLEGVGLFVVGSPTRGFRPTPAITQALSSITLQGGQAVKVAAFDTRIAAKDLKFLLARWIVNAGGYAAKRIAAQLKSSGGELILAPEGFYVQGTEGPMKAGELERAAQWADKLLASV